MITYRTIQTGGFAFALCLLSAFFVSCSDTWDDHYDGSPSSIKNEGSLWSAIEGNASLSNFASVLTATGYDRELNGKQVFTVFAPTNDKFTADQAAQLIEQYKTQQAAQSRDEDNTTVKEFVRNHIALYNYSVAPDKSDTISIVMMNGKYQKLTHDAFGSTALKTFNALYDNGVLFTIDSTASYTPNVFEYFGKDPDLSGANAFLTNSRHYRLDFDAAHSVPGEIVNGRTQYVDSVFTFENDLFDNDALNADINDEDSTYWMITPTNTLWESLVTQYEPYFNYHESAMKNTDKTKGDLDSLIYTNTRMAVLGGTVFSRNVNTDTRMRDSLTEISTNACYRYEDRLYYWGADSLHYYEYAISSDTAGHVVKDVLKDNTEVAVSNGKILKTDTWKIDPRETFMRDIIIEGEGSRIRREVQKIVVRKDTIENITLNVRNVPAGNPYYNKISGHAFLELTPVYDNIDVDATFNLYGYLSNVPYDIYVVMAPAAAYRDSLATESERAPVTFTCELSTLNANGQRTSEQIWDFQGNDLVTHVDSVDMIKILEGYVFNWSVFDVVEQYPMTTLKLSTYVFDDDIDNNLAQRTMRLDYILLRPREDLLP